MKYLLQPGQTTPPLQPLDVWYSSGYVQDEWRPRSNLTVTAGLRVDVPKFGNTAFDNPVADALTFRDQDGSPVKYNTGGLPKTTAYWSPRVGFNWDPLRRSDDAGARRDRPLHRQAAVRLDLEPDRQHRRAVRILSGQQHDRVSVQPESGQVQAGRRPVASPPATSSTSPIRASASRRRGEPTSAPTGSCRGDSSEPATSSTTATSTTRSTSTRTCRRPNRRTRASTTGRAGWRRRRFRPAPTNWPGRSVRDALEQRPRQPGDRRLRHQELEPELLVERLGLALEDDEPRLLVQGRLQLRRLEEPRRAVVHGRQFVGVGEPDRVRSEQPAAGLLHQLARQARVPAGQLFAPVLQLRCDDDLGVLRRAPDHPDRTRSARTPATSSRATRTATGERQRPDLHPAQHVGDELQAADGERQDATRPPIRRRRSSSTSRTTRT